MDILLAWVGKWMCKLFGHSLRFDTEDVSGPSHCVRWGCQHVEPGIIWHRE